ncbi:N-acetylmuramoyl-L-alanine amidase [Clostridium sp. MT-14]|uniref:N-acetylmuramoyl-L-alanine amidase n=1 Tax=Clostridium aromativorans TaxID=2836848 RepID=A0ABS8N1Q4_9CLOT|nr:N-acetylmuramoyl-L-alanine amidase [Clostridium aromativorans]MCC9293724.1 N-acetylmuramoyl-L-alanine amidase [Clostridium aromativorans]
MKNIKTYMVLLVSFVLMFAALAGINIVQAADYDGAIIGKNVEPNKSWNVKFSMKVDTSTVNNSNVVVTDSEGNIVPVSLQVGSDGSSVIVSPETPYTYGKTYNLIIKSGLKSINGRSLKKDDIKMQFIIKAKPASNGKYTVTIDPGHGMGQDVGATGINGLQEDDITLAVGLKTGKILESKGINVVYTRTTDMRSTPMSVIESLQKRCDISNNANSKYFVCIHANYFDEPGANGTETYYYPGSSEGQRLASNIQNSIIREVGMYDRKIKEDERGLYVLKNTTAPAVLVELGFVTNPGDAAKLNSDAYRQKFAQAIADGILQTLGY